MRKKIEKEGKKKRKFSRKTKIIIWAIVLVIIIFIGTNLYLLINFLLGNDVIIKLESEKQNIFLSHGQSSQVDFKTSVLTNPFCNAICNYEFKRISDNKSIDKNSFTLKTLDPITQSYNIIAPDKGVGQELYSFNIECKAIKKPLCQTSNELNKQSYLLTLNYELNEEENRIKENSKQMYIDIANKTNITLQILENMNKIIDSFTSINKSELNYEIDNFMLLKEELTKFNETWSNQNYSLVKAHIENINKSYKSNEADFREFNQSFYEYLNNYNSLVRDIQIVLENVSTLKDLNFSNTTILLVEELINETNNFKMLLESKSLLEEKNLTLISIKNKITLIQDLRNSEVSQNITMENKTSNELQNYSLEALEFNNSVSYPEIILLEPLTRCCFFNDCTKCCDESCSDDKEKYPVIFVHGHDFSASISPEYNLNAFEPIQSELEKSGYINAGFLTTSTSENKIKGILGRPTYPISIKASYYLDYLQEQNKLSILYTKQDSIDTYSIRLKDIIDDVKYRTGKDKVIVITHSMGGLVLRRYMQVFGEESIYMVILIACPNKGITKDAYSSCKLFGENSECNDMYEKSLLINKLNSQTKPQNSKVYNIIGIGGSTYGDDGDGIVTNKSSYLDFADKNYYVKGNCSEGAFDYLHSKIINPKKHPETLDIIESILKNK